MGPVDASNGRARGSVQKSTKRFSAFLTLVALVFTTATPSFVQAQTASSAASTAQIHGRIVDGNGGLPVVNAAVELNQGNKVVATTHTAGDGFFAFSNEPPGVYNVVIRGEGFQPTVSQDILASSGTTSTIQIAIQRSSSGGLKAIGTVRAAAGSLQTSATINAHVEPSTLQRENYMRAGDVLQNIPGVSTFTGSSLGDSLGVSIRGFNSSETSTLLDGHPIGGLGAFGGTFDYQVSPFYGLRDIGVTFGSGATGVYGASTIAGAVNFLTLEPTRDSHFGFTQGYGTFNHAMTGLQATGTRGKLGYALAHAVQGTEGSFNNGVVAQTGNYGSDITAANIAANTYAVSANYQQTNNLAKLNWSFDPNTQLQATVYSATSWDDKSGNGDNDNIPYAQRLYNIQSGLAGNGNQSCIQDGNGNCIPASVCTGTQVLATDAGYQCYSPEQAASLTSGPTGGGVGPWQAIRNQDYDARLTKRIGRNLVTAESYVDQYGLDYNRNSAGSPPLGGGFHTDFYTTRGTLLSDTIQTSDKNEIGFGYSYQHEKHLYISFDPSVPSFAYQQPFFLTNNNYFVRDTWTPNAKLTFFANLWLNHSLDQNTSSFDPRFSVVYRPTTSDVVRVTTGRANSIPDPALLFSDPQFNTTPTNINPQCGPGPVNQVGSVSNSKLKPETANDVELSYGHRFNAKTTFQAHVYQAYEQNALFSGNLPLASLGVLPPAALLSQYLSRISNFCNQNTTIDNLSVSATYNAAKARYRGIELSGQVGLLRNVTGSIAYDVQSASYLDVPDAILMANVTIINGGQVPGIPLRKGNLGLEFANPNGLDLAMDANYTGNNNGLDRNAYWQTNASVSQTFDKHYTINFGINNLFNSAVQTYGYFGLGEFRPENQFGTDTTPFTQSGNERFGLSPRAYFLSLTFRN
ncbi:MAG: hypothetical protein NVSMB31_09560 [Vulcanimicrobiaceae bacterium]